MNWFDRWLANKVQRSWEQAREEKVYAEPKQSTGLFVGSPNKISRSRDLDIRPTMNFKMHHAENGWVIEIHGFDERTDSNWSKLYLIGEHEEFDKALAHIMTVQALRN